MYAVYRRHTADGAWRLAAVHAAPPTAASPIPEAAALLVRRFSAAEEVLDVLAPDGAPVTPGGARRVQSGAARLARSHRGTRRGEHHAAAAQPSRRDALVVAGIVAGAILVGTLLDGGGSDAEGGEEDWGDEGAAAEPE